MHQSKGPNRRFKKIGQSLVGFLILLALVLSPGYRNGLLAQDEDKAKQLPFNVNLVYSPKYNINLNGLERLHPFDIKKFQKIHDQLIKEQLVTAKQVQTPVEVTAAQLRLVHSEEYLATKLKNKNRVIQYLEAPPMLANLVTDFDSVVLKPFRYTTGGTLLAAKLSLESGIGVNIGGGYHHAKPTHGEGFCIYADIPIAVRWLQKNNKIKRAIIVDVDAHQGNGTIVCFPDSDEVTTFSMHEGGIYPIPKEKGDVDIELKSGTTDEEYLKILNERLPKVLDDAKADICFIVAGCDTLEADPLASLKMTHEGIVKRDQQIVEMCRKRKIPVVYTTSGGYSKDAWKAQHKSIANLIKTYGLAKTEKVDDN